MTYGIVQCLISSLNRQFRDTCIAIHVLETCNVCDPVCSLIFYERYASKQSALSL